MTGIIYYNENRNQANKILERIIEQYKMQDIKTINFVVGESSCISSYATFDNGDYWAVRRASDNARGYRCNVAYVDRSIPYEIYRAVVLPAMIEFPFCAEHLWGEGDLHLDYTPCLPF